MAPMELPQWLMISEGLLVVAGFIGVLVSGKKADEVDPPPDDVGVSLEAELCLDTSALHHARKTCRRERRPPPAGEHERRLGILLTLQLAQGPHLVATDGMGTRHAFLGPTNVQDGMGEIHLIPARDAFVAVV